MDIISFSISVRIDLFNQYLYLQDRFRRFLQFRSGPAQLPGLILRYISGLCAAYQLFQVSKGRLDLLLYFLVHGLFLFIARFFYLTDQTLCLDRKSVV